MTVSAKMNNIWRSICNSYGICDFSSIRTICLDLIQFKRSLSDRIKSCSSYIFESTAYVHLEIELIRREILHNYQAIEKQYFIKQNCQSYETLKITQFTSSLFYFSFSGLLIIKFCLVCLFCAKWRKDTSISD